MTACADDNPRPPAAPMDAARNVAKLAKALDACDGFGLFVLINNAPAARQALIASLDKSTTRSLSLIDVKGSTPQRVVDEIERRAQDAGSNDALAVLGFETMLTSADGEREAEAVRQLGYARTRLAALDRPIVLAMSDYAASLLAAESPDLWDWRRAAFDALDERDRLDAVSTARTEWHADELVTLGPGERQRRVQQLRRLLLDGESLKAETKIELFIQLGSLLRASGNAAEALDAFEQAQAIADADTNTPDQRRSLIASWMGAVLQNLGRLDEAIRHHELAERIDRAAFDDDHPSVASRLNNIGSVLEAKGDLDGALAKYREAERIDRVALGDDHPNVANRVNNIGGVLKAKGDLDGALAKYREAERIDRAAFGDDHPNVAICLNNIGAVLQAKGDLDGALANYREAERIDRAAFGDDHRNVAIRVNNIGMVRQAKGDLDGALVNLREAERIDRAAFGDDHPSVAIRVNNIGAVLQAKGDLDGALANYREAERIDRATFGDEHPLVAIRVNNIGGVHSARGERDEARRCAADAFRIVLRCHGPRGEYVATSGLNLLLVGGDPLTIARELGGDELAAQAAAAIREEAVKQGVDPGKLGLGE